MRLLLLLLFTPALLFSQDYYEYEISPSLIMEGSTLKIKFTATDEIDFHNNFPRVNALKYQGASQGQQIINNYRERSITLNFYVQKAGDITIPEMEVTLDGKIYKCKKRTFKVWPANIDEGKNEIIQTRILYNGKEEIPEKIYTGQSFTVDYEVSVIGSWRYLDRNTFNDYRPVIKADDLNLQIQDTDFNRYIYHLEFNGSKTVNGVPYRTKTYRYVMAPVKSGKYDFTIKQQVIAVKKIPGLPRNRSKEVEFNRKQIINVIPVPAPPSDLLFLDLTGKWQVNGKTSKAEARTGHTFELIISVDGSGGDKKRLSAPELTIPGFEIDPRPEIKTDKKTATISYAMRALRPDAKIPELIFGTFDHEQDKFVSHPVNASIKITGTALNLQKTPKANINNIAAQPIKLPTNTSYVPPLVTATKQITLPLAFNISPVWYILFFIFPLAFMGILLTKNRDRSAAGKEGKKRSALTKEIRSLCGKIDQTQDQSLINNELIPLLAEYHDLPQGTTADELSEHLEDKELASMLQQISHSEYLPTSVISQNLKAITTKLAKIIIFTVAFIPAFLKAESPYELYREGNYKLAAEAFENSLSASKGDASLYANLANCYFMLEDYPAALAAYETASRLAPANSQIKSGLNATLKIMKISREQELFSVKDKLRPDQWLKTGIVIWIIFWGIMIIQIFRKIPGKRWTALWGAILFSVCLLTYFNQGSNRYQEGQYLLKNDTILLTGPDVKALSSISLPKGEVIQQTNLSGDYLSITRNGSELWISKQDLIKVW